MPKNNCLFVSYNLEQTLRLLKCISKGFDDVSEFGKEIEQLQENISSIDFSHKEFHKIDIPVKLEARTYRAEASIYISTFDVIQNTGFEQFFSALKEKEQVENLDSFFVSLKAINEKEITGIDGFISCYDKIVGHYQSETNVVVYDQKQGSFFNHTLYEEKEQSLENYIEGIYEDFDLVLSQQSSHLQKKSKTWSETQGIFRILEIFEVNEWSQMTEKPKEEIIEEEKITQTPKYEYNSDDLGEEIDDEDLEDLDNELQKPVIVSKVVQQKATQLKDEGNKAFQNQKYQEALKFYDEAIQFNPNDHVFYSNRSLVYATLEQYEKALLDADSCLKIEPKFVKAYYRKGISEFNLKQYTNASETYKKGLKIDSNNKSLKEGLEQAQSQLKS